MAAGASAEQVQLGFLDSVLGLAALAVQRIVQVGGCTIEIRDDEARIAISRAIPHASSSVTRCIFDYVAHTCISQHEAFSRSDDRLSTAYSRACPIRLDNHVGFGSFAIAALTAANFFSSNWVFWR